MYGETCMEHKPMKSGCNTSSRLRKGAWTAEEDTLLKKCIEKYGEGKWHLVPHKAGLNRCRKSCRLRWLNYLRPNIKRGDFQEDEVDLILRLHKLLGNRWSLIAGRIPGRTANDVKNYWNTHLRSHANKQKKELELSQDTTIAVIKPQAQTFSKILNRLAGDCQIIESHSDGSLKESLNDGNMSPRLIVDEKMNKYLEDLFDDREKVIDGRVGWSFSEEEEEEAALNVNQNSLFDFPMDELVLDFLDAEQL